jgi:gluconate 2-dehydrogenase gamma chain
LYWFSIRSFFASTRGSPGEVAGFRDVRQPFSQLRNWGNSQPDNDLPDARYAAYQGNFRFFQLIQRPITLIVLQLAPREIGVDRSNDLESSMKKPTNMNRRRFLKTTAAGAAVFTVACSSRGQSTWRSLTSAEAETLDAICEQIIPADRDPGASWAGVVKFIDKQLAGFYREHRQAYRAGISEANNRAGGNFARATHEKQLEILKGMEKDESTKAFFALVVSHAMQGFYGNPRHGGNRDYCSWRMLGVPPSPIRGRDQYDFAKGGRS